MQLNLLNSPSSMLSILNSLNIGIFITNLDGQPLWVNRASLAMIDCTKKHLFASDIYTLEKEGKFTPSVSRCVIENRKQVSAVHHYRGKDYLMTGKLFSLQGKEPDAVLVQAYNIGESITSSLELRETEELLSYAMLELRRAYQAQQGDKSKNIFISQSPAYQKCLELAERVSLVDMTVLLMGETGVGKGWLANRIHRLSPRHEKPMISINCAAIPSTLLESELFGYVKGAFTDASRDGRVGYVSLAEGGTLFLDEVGELPLELQSKLLHLLQERTYRPIGGKEKKADIRVIAATNADLEKMVKDGSFRSDLFYRLNILPITIPSLRERHEDILPLAQFILGRQNERYNRKLTISSAALKALYQYSWPGNIRELENIIERMMIVCSEDEITVADLQLNIDSNEDECDFMKLKSIDSEQRPLPDVVAEFEWQAIQKALDNTGSTRKAAKKLGVTQSWLMRRIKKYSVEKG
ncbi:sigma-54 interaction domain-containing protein [Oceanisphaera sp.]|uniref:sigma-54 interaction domain-containing protein n=1 Tax=Oceanisphaera sp. TaxID=1929979 RepID=UPI003A92038C